MRRQALPGATPGGAEPKPGPLPGVAAVVTWSAITVKGVTAHTRKGAARDGEALASRHGWGWEGQQASKREPT